MKDIAVSGVNELASMTSVDLLAWIWARVRGPAIPPLTGRQDETPDDLLVLLARSNDDLPFAERMRALLLAALREITQTPDLRDGVDAGAVASVAHAVSRLNLRGAFDPLLALAQRSAFAGAAELREDAEEAVILALARLQPPTLLWDEWIRLLGTGSPRLRALAAAALRISCPERCHEALPLVLEALDPQEQGTLGQVLWSWRWDPRVGLASAFVSLEAEAQDRCRAALSAVGGDAGALPPRSSSGLDRVDGYVLGRRAAVDYLETWSREIGEGAVVGVYDSTAYYLGTDHDDFVFGWADVLADVLGWRVRLDFENDAGNGHHSYTIQRAVLHGPEAIERPLPGAYLTSAAELVVFLRLATPPLCGDFLGKPGRRFLYRIAGEPLGPGDPRLAPGLCVCLLRPVPRWRSPSVASPWEDLLRPGWGA